MKKLLLTAMMIVIIPSYSYAVSKGESVLGSNSMELKSTLNDEVVIGKKDILVAIGLGDIGGLVGGGGSDVDLSGGKTELLALFEKSTSLFMESQELLLRSLDMNTQADQVKAGIEYAKNSKNSEADRMANSIQVTTEASKALEGSDVLKSGGLSAKGKIMYVKAFPSGIKGFKATLKLIPVSKQMVEGITASPLSAFKELGGVAKIIPKVPGYIDVVYSTMSLMLSGAKANDIEGSDDLESELGDL
tara:strand:- start:212 stop:952 length:741 start_codon:yes stop_codon:yes gene_type:complete